MACRKKSAPIKEDITSVNASLLSKRSISNSHISATKSRYPGRSTSPLEISKLDQGFSKHADETMAKIKAEKKDLKSSMNKSRGHSANPSANRSQNNMSRSSIPSMTEEPVYKRPRFNAPTREQRKVNFTMQKDYEVTGRDFNRSRTNYILKDDNVSHFHKNPKELVSDEKPAEKDKPTPRGSMPIKTRRSKTIRTKSSKKNVCVD